MSDKRFRELVREFAGQETLDDADEESADAALAELERLRVEVVNLKGDRERDAVALTAAKDALEYHAEPDCAECGAEPVEGEDGIATHTEACQTGQAMDLVLERLAERNP